MSSCLKCKNLGICRFQDEIRASIDHFIDETKRMGIMDAVFISYECRYFDSESNNEIKKLNELFVPFESPQDDISYEKEK